MPPRFEPLWRCRLCGSKGLLGESHAFCGNCGNSRDGERVAFPGWDELVSSTRHRFHGATYRCCQRGWSTHARYCPSCGAPLHLPWIAEGQRSPGPTDAVHRSPQSDHDRH